MALISIPEITVYKRIEVKVLPRPEVEGAKPWMTSGELMLLKSEHDRRRIRHRSLLVLGLGIVGYFVVLELSLAMFAATPTDAALAAQVSQVAQQALATFSTPTVPLAVSGTAAVLEQKISRSRQLYQFTVSLRLLQPLYLPAHSNGTLEYEQLRLGLANAKSRSKSAGQSDPGIFPVDLPQLVQRSHFAGEKTRITTTLEARRTGWWWRFAPLSGSKLVCRRPLQGTILSTFPHALVYDEVRPDPALRARLNEVRAFLRQRAQVAHPAQETSGGLP